MACDGFAKEQLRAHYPKIINIVNIFKIDTLYEVHDKCYLGDALATSFLKSAILQAENYAINSLIANGLKLIFKAPKFFRDPMLTNLTFCRIFSAAAKVQKLKKIHR